MQLDVMLCDHAQVAGGKLFIAGANIDRMQLPAGTQPPYILNFAASGLVRVPWTDTNADHALQFRLLTEDGEDPTLAGGLEVGPQGIGGEMRFNVGRPPQLAGGEEQMVPFAFNFQAIPLGAGGRFAVIFAVDGQELRRLPFTVQVEQPRDFGPSSLPF